MYDNAIVLCRTSTTISFLHVFDCYEISLKYAVWQDCDVPVICSGFLFLRWRLATESILFLVRP